jgi:ActR/RegA family two-component response regulator
MNSAKTERKRVLFVDDEESIRLTLPLILEKRGFHVQTASSVGEALAEINSSSFDVLLADLNLREQGDGFLVLSAMRHIQPKCVNFVLTGFPGFETAIHAIQAQVDDYFIKPAEIDGLISRIERKLDERGPVPSLPPKRLPAILSQYRDQIQERIISRVKVSEPEPGEQPPSVDSLIPILGALIEHLDEEREVPTTAALALAADHTRRRKAAGCDMAQLLKDYQLIPAAIFDLLQSGLVPRVVVGLDADCVRLSKFFHELELRSLQVFENSEAGADSH